MAKKAPAKKKTTTKKAPAKKKTTKALAKVGSTEVAAASSMLPEELQGAFDPALMGASIDKDDIVIPKLWLLQSMSECVTDDNHEAIAGEYRNSRTLDLKAEKGEAVEVLILDNYKSWQCFKEDETGKMKYTETMDYYKNPDLKYDEIDPMDNKKIHRDLVLGFFVLLMDEITEGKAFPYIIDFKRTSREAGKNLSTSIAELQSHGAPSYAKVFSIGSEQDQVTKDGTTHRFYRKTVGEGRWITKDELGTIINWVKDLSKKKSEGKVHIDDSDVRSDNGNGKSDAANNTIETTARTVNGQSKF